MSHFLHLKQPYSLFTINIIIFSNIILSTQFLMITEATATNTTKQEIQGSMQRMQGMQGSGSLNWEKQYMDPIAYQDAPHVVNSPMKSIGNLPPFAFFYETG